MKNTQTKNPKVKKYPSRFNLEMRQMGLMNKSSMRGIFLSVILISALSVISIPINAYAADDIIVKSVAFEKSIIMDFTNVGKEEVNSVRIWLGSDYNFESFKTENGWVGEKTPQGVIIFTSTNPIKQGDSVKFGVKTKWQRPCRKQTAIGTLPRHCEEGEAQRSNLS